MPLIAPHERLGDAAAGSGRGGRPRARLLLGAALAFLMATGTIAPAFAEVVKAEAEVRQEKGFGRLVLTFKDRTLIPQYSTKQANGVVVLEFEDEIDVGVEQVASKLAPYVTVVRRDPEGKALRIALARQVRVNTMDAGEKLFVDFLPPKWNGNPPSLPQDVIEALAKRAEAAIKAARDAEMARVGTRVQPKLDFKIGRLPTFTRFSFGWNVPFDTRMTREGERVTLTFNRVAKLDLSQIDVDPVPGLVDVFADPNDETMKVVFTVAPDADVRAFREKDAYVLDLVRASAPANAGEAAIRPLLSSPA